ncbi:MAG: response regulator [Alistipes sp.]|nr:response regulator [Alistipes sp.]
MNPKKILIALWLLLPAVVCPQEIVFRALPTRERLSDNAVMALWQDERGFIWIGTRHGVNLYNGHDLKQYKYDKDTDNRLHHDNITQIAGNGAGEIYFKSSKGISAFDIRRSEFRTIFENSVRAICYASGLYAATDNEIWRFDGETFRLYHRFPDKKMLTALAVTDEAMLVGTLGQGLCRLERTGRQTQIIPRITVVSIFRDSRGRFWICSREDGLFLLDGEQVTSFRHRAGVPGTLSSDFVRCCTEDAQGGIWVGTSNGLNRYNPETASFTVYRDRASAFSGSSVWSLLCDTQGTVWVGSYFGGLDCFNPTARMWRYYGEIHPDAGFSPVGPIVEDDARNLWIGDEEGWINRYDTTTRTFERYRPEVAAGSHTAGVKALWFDASRRALWVGTNLGGLYRMDLATKRFRVYRHDADDPASILSDIVTYLIPWRDRIILSTDVGICLFDPERERAEPLVSEETGHSVGYSKGLLIDHRGVLWICGGNGTYTYDLENDRLTCYQYNPDRKGGIGSNSVNSIYEDSSRRIWLCCDDNGIDCYDPQRELFVNFDRRKNGLGSNCVYDARELSADRILFTTDEGFSILDCGSGRFVNYDRESGIPLRGFNERAACVTCDGEVFLGGVDGMLSFREEDLVPRPQSYSVVPFRLFVNGREIAPGDGSGILDEELGFVDCLKLGPKQAMFSIEYAATNYLPANREHLEYFLEGFSESWTALYGSYTITYTNLDAGTYTLRVRSGNPKIPESRLRIVILPPWYRTVAARLLCAVLLCVVAGWLVVMYRNRIKLQESLKYEQKRSEDIERLNQAKLRFFTNISHEFRTPLTLIIGQMELLFRAHQFAPEIHNKIASVYRNCLQLRELITELLDFRKLEQGYTTIRAVEQDFPAFVQANTQRFADFAALRKVSLRFRKSVDTLPLWFDPKQLRKVLNNLISNALKYTPEGGSVTVSVHKGNGEAIVEVSDTGRGIAPEELARIFDRFYQTDGTDSAPYAGSGIGLALTREIVELHHGTIDVYSEPGEGATFCVRLKRGKAHFEASRIADSESESETAPAEPPVAEIPRIVEVPVGKAEPGASEVSEAPPAAPEILIVEDNDALREMLEKAFAPFYAVSTAADGQEAWERLTSAPLPALVLSDVVMPRLSGTELCKRIKENPNMCHLPVVLLTARTAAEYNLEGLRMGADDYVTKPFGVDALIVRCNNLVNNRMVLQEKFGKYPQRRPKVHPSNPADKKFMTRVTQIVERHLDDSEFNVDKLVGELYMSRTKFFTVLKRITGDTPSEFLLKMRLGRAALLLKEHPELSIAEISARMGFSSPRQFSKNFKERYGIIPQRYRKQPE